MPYRHIDPENVLSPKDYVEVVEVIHRGVQDNGETSFSVAHILWDGESRIGVRWNISEKEWDEPLKASGEKVCVGMPASRGYPVWFVMPEEMLDINSEIWKKIQKVRREDS